MIHYGISFTTATSESKRTLSLSYNKYVLSSKTLEITEISKISLN